MKKLILILFLISMPAYPHGGGEEAPPNVGPGKGIESYDEHDGMKLSKEAIKQFKIESNSLPSGTSWTLPKTAVVFSLAQTFIFKESDRVFQKVKVDVKPKDSLNVTISAKNLKAGDLVVVKGVPFLRVAEIDVTAGGEEDEHGHGKESDEHKENEKHEGHDEKDNHDQAH